MDGEIEKAKDIIAKQRAGTLGKPMYQVIDELVWDKYHMNPNQRQSLTNITDWTEYGPTIQPNLNGEGYLATMREQAEDLPMRLVRWAFTNWGRKGFVSSIKEVPYEKDRA